MLEYLLGLEFEKISLVGTRPYAKLYDETEEFIYDWWCQIIITDNSVYKGSALYEGGVIQHGRMHFLCVPVAVYVRPRTSEVCILFEDGMERIFGYWDPLSLPPKVEREVTDLTPYLRLFDR